MGILDRLDEREKRVKPMQILVDEGVWAKAYTRTGVDVKTKEVIVPEGYSAIGSNEVDKLLHLKDLIINKYKVFSYDYETSANIEDKREDYQDNHVVGVSFAFKRGQAFYLPIKHIYYDYNWDKQWLKENFLEPILMHPDVTLVAHNFMAEHIYNLLDFGIDIYPKTHLRKVVDTIYLVKAVAPDALMKTRDKDDKLLNLAVGLKDAAKELLADENGYIHGLLHVDEVKDFEEMVTTEEIIGYYKQGEKKGQPKYGKRVVTFGELDVDQKVINYTCADSDWALGLYEVLMPKAKELGLTEILFELDFKFALTLPDYILAGWHVDRTRLKQLEEKALKALYGYTEEDGTHVKGLEETMRDELLKYTRMYNLPIKVQEGKLFIPAGVHSLGYDKRGNELTTHFKKDKEIDWGSPKDMQWLIFHAFAVPTKGMEFSSSTGLPSTSTENIKKIKIWYKGAYYVPFLEMYLDYKKYTKILTTYTKESEKGNGLANFIRKDTSKVHTELVNAPIATWRLASSKPNLQNIPRPDNDPMGIRSVFVAPTYDPNADYSHLHYHTRPVPMINLNKLSGETMWIGCDYSQIELKVLAWYTKEKTMIDTLKNGGDLHSVVAKEVFNLPCETHEVKDKFKHYRYRAKKVNFGLVYGMTAHGLAKDPEMRMTVPEAEAFIETYMNMYPGVRQYAKDMIAFAKKHGYVETMFGHRRNIPEINSYDPYIKSKAENRAMNTPIQGSAADIIRLAMVRIKEAIPKEAPYLKPVMQIHDELIFECPVEYLSEGARFVKRMMEQDIPGFTEIMPIVAEPAVGKVWAHNLDIDWDDDGTPFVRPKVYEDPADMERGDVTLDMIEYALPLYEMAGIEIRPKFIPKKKKEKKTA